jgi:ribosomal protein L11 methyltransferase
MRFGERLWICPGGQLPPVGTTPEPTIVWLDPGLAFGTGTHATTALCLEWLDQERPTGRRVLDVGCGSGILAVAALLLGAHRAHGLDIDPQALTASTDNATRNGVLDRLTLAAAEAPWDTGYDVVLANILAEPLIELAPRIAQATRPGGAVVLAGLLTEQAEWVAAAYRPWFTMETPRERDGWTRLSGRRL